MKYRGGVMIEYYIRKLYCYSQSYREPYKTLWQIKYVLKSRYRRGIGSIQIGDWFVDYIHSHTLASMWRLQFLEKYNDFFSNKPNPYIIDCGSNIGVSVLRYKQLYPNCRITAF